MRTGKLLTPMAVTGSVVLGFAAVPVAAQEATPGTGTGNTVCAAEPRDVDEIVGFYFSPEGTPLATPSATTVGGESELPSGEPADPETVAAVDAVVTEIFACFGDEQYARAFALMTDDLARQFGPDLADPSEDTREEVRSLLESQLAATPSPSGAPVLFGAPRDVRVLSEGRVGGIWEMEGDEAFLVFEQQDGQWLLDEILFIAGEADGTPTP